MKDDVQTTRKQLQELKESHLTGFVDDAQYAEHLARLERKLIDAVMMDAPAAVQATPPPVWNEARSEQEVAPPPRGLPKWLPVLGATALVSVLVLVAGGWWSRPGAPSVESADSRVGAEALAVSPQPQSPVPSAAATIVNAAAPAGTSISGTITLASALLQQAGPTDTLFVYARAMDGPPVPLAVIRKQVKDLPMDFTLDDSMGIWSSAKLSAFSKVIVTARISKSGEGQPNNGDLQGQSDPVAAGSTGLRIEIGTVLKK